MWSPLIHQSAQYHMVFRWKGLRGERQGLELSVEPSLCTWWLHCWPSCLQDTHTPGKLRPVPEAQRMASSSGDQRDYIGGGDSANIGPEAKVDRVTRARITGAR